MSFDMNGRGVEIRLGDALQLRLGAGLNLHIQTSAWGPAQVTVDVDFEIAQAMAEHASSVGHDEEYHAPADPGGESAAAAVARARAKFERQEALRGRGPSGARGYQRPAMPNEFDQPGRLHVRRTTSPVVEEAPVDGSSVIPAGMTQEDYAAYLQVGAVALRELVHGWELNLGKLGWAQPDRPALLRTFHQLYSDQIQAYILQSGNLPVAVMNVLNPEAEGEEGPREWRVAQVANSMVQVGSNQGLWPGLTHHLRYPKSMYAVIQKVTNLNRDEMTRANMRSDTICAVCLKESPNATGWLLCRARHESIPAGDLAKHLLFRVCGECAVSEQVFPYGLIEGERVPNDRIRGLPTDCYFAQVARIGTSESGLGISIPVVPVVPELLDLPPRA